MKKQMCLKYLLYLLLLSFVVFGGRYVIVICLTKVRNLTWGASGAYIYNILMLFVFMVIGAVLGIESLLKEGKKEGTWKVNLCKLVILGVPSFYFSLTYCIYYCEVDFIRNMLSYPAAYLLTKNSDIFVAVFQLILGYSIVTSFYKTDKI